MFDTYEIIVKDFGDRAANHILQQLNFLNLNLKKIMDQYSDLKEVIDAVRDDVGQVKTKINAFLSALPTSGGMTQAQVDELKQEVTNIDVDAKFVGSRIDSAMNPPVDNPPVENPPVDNPPVDNPPVDNPPVENPPVDNPPVDNPPVDNPPVQEPPVDNPSVGDGDGSTPIVDPVTQPAV